MGVHAVRITMDGDGLILDAERFDRDKGEFVQDYKTALRVADHIEADKVSAEELEHFCDTVRLWA